MKERTELDTVAAPDLLPCPRCQRPAHITSERGKLLATWHRVHCAVCSIGYGGETVGEARERWEKTVAKWGR
ncbi:MAG: hypothetical protein IT454_16270 [Planctomycetes bacterium]|nr:hypothetical protein [Planctomycetota bacterium]